MKIKFWQNPINIILKISKQNFIYYIFLNKNYLFK